MTLRARGLSIRASKAALQTGPITTATNERSKRSCHAADRAVVPMTGRVATGHAVPVNQAPGDWLDPDEWHRVGRGLRREFGSLTGADLPPPFRTVSEDAEGNPRYWQDYGALQQIDPTEAVLIADFGPGSDAVLVVDFRTDPPQVLRLVWSEEGNRWMPVASTVPALRQLLGLAGGD